MRRLVAMLSVPLVIAACEGGMGGGGGEARQRGDLATLPRGLDRWGTTTPLRVGMTLAYYAYIVPSWRGPTAVGLTDVSKLGDGVELPHNPRGG